jgi:hypothetical protein
MMSLGMGAMNINPKMELLVFKMKLPLTQLWGKMLLPIPLMVLLTLDLQLRVLDK